MIKKVSAELNLSASFMPACIIYYQIFSTVVMIPLFQFFNYADHHGRKKFSPVVSGIIHESVIRIFTSSVMKSFRCFIVEHAIYSTAMECK